MKRTLLHMSYLSKTDPEIADIIEMERLRQNNGLELIASENLVSRAVLEAMGSIMTNKYAEGYPGKRYYGGCEFHDMAENLARDRLKSSSVPSMQTSSRIQVPRQTWPYILHS